MEDEITAKQLISSGRLTKRVTIIPLTKVGTARREHDSDWWVSWLRLAGHVTKAGMAHD